MLLTETKSEYCNKIQDGDDFYFVEEKANGRPIKSVSVFNRILKETMPNDQNDIVLDLVVQTKGIYLITHRQVTAPT